MIRHHHRSHSVCSDSIFVVSLVVDAVAVANADADVDAVEQLPWQATLNAKRTLFIHDEFFAVN